MKAKVASNLRTLSRSRVLQIIDAVLPSGIDDGLSVTVLSRKQHRGSYGRETRHIAIEVNESSTFPVAAIVEGERFETRSIEETVLVLIACCLIRARNAQQTEKLGSAATTDAPS